MTFARLHIAAIALGVMLTVFGHDALMATDPHTFAEIGHAGHHESPAPANDTECGPITGMHAKPSHERDFDDPGVAQALPQATGEPTAFLAHRSAEPEHSPSTRRALLQVYLN